MLQINEGVSRDFFRIRRKAREVPRVTGREPRVNGDLGLSQAGANLATWNLKVITPSEERPDQIINPFVGATSSRFLGPKLPSISNASKVGART